MGFVGARSAYFRKICVFPLSTCQSLGTIMEQMGIVQVWPHKGKDFTGRLMYQFATKFCDDIPALDRIPFSVWYSRVKTIPYKSDDELFPNDPGRVVEVLARPGYLMDRNIFQNLDCKKKAILIGAWAAANRCPFCFVAVSEMGPRPQDIHHVFSIVDFGNGWRTADATLPEFYVGQVFPITYAEELQR